MIESWSTYFLIGAIRLIKETMDDPEPLQEHRW